MALGYGGSEQFTFENSRKVLPHILPVGHTVAIWKILKDFIGTDLSKVCLPVALCEPLNTLQKSMEIMCNERLLLRALRIIEGGDTPEESCMRLGSCSLFAILQYAISQNRFKKPFNPILGETFEYVQKGYRFVSEQVSHHPPITACHIEGPGYNFFA